MARGGYREPSKPSSVSGPGAKSRRTDGGPAQVLRQVTGGAYGDAQQFEQLQQQAPLANSQSSSMAAGRPQGGGANVAPLTPFDAPTARPDEPVTAGNPLGPGPGAEALGVAGGASKDAAKLAQWVPLLSAVAMRDEATDSFRKFVSALKRRSVE